MEQKQWSILWEDYYEILQVHRNATNPVIEVAYRRLSQELHPDKVGGDGSAMKRLNRAHEVLSDKKERAAYDHGWDARNGLIHSSSTPLDYRSTGNPASRREDTSDVDPELYLMEAEILPGASASVKGDLIFTDKRLLCVPKSHASVIDIVSIPYGEITSVQQKSSFMALHMLSISQRDGNQWKFMFQRGVSQAVFSFLRAVIDPSTHEAYVAQYGQPMPLDLMDRIFGNQRDKDDLEEEECVEITTGKFAVSLITDLRKDSGLIVISSAGFAFYQNPVLHEQPPTVSRVWGDVKEIGSRSAGMFKKDLVLRLRNGESLQFAVSRWDQSAVSTALDKAVELYKPTP